MDSDAGWYKRKADWVKAKEETRHDNNDVKGDEEEEAYPCCARQREIRLWYWPLRGRTPIHLLYECLAQ